MRYRFRTLDVFTDRRFAGNPLAVIPDADGLTAEQMQRIAAEFNLSETAFVLPAPGPEATHAVRIFTPTSELPFAGHPTIGTAFVLADEGLLEREGGFAEGIGVVGVAIVRSDGRPCGATLRVPISPTREPQSPGREEVAELLSLPAGTLIGDPELWTCGNTFLFVEVQDRQALAAVRLRLDRFAKVLGPHGCVDVWTRDAVEGADVQVRLFAPLDGVPEDPATGSAAATFAGLLAARVGEGSHQCVLAQGYEMGRPSRLDVAFEARAGVAHDVTVTGECVAVGEGHIEV